MSQPLQETGKKKNKIDTQISYYIIGSSFDTKAASLYSVALHADGNQFTLGISNQKTGDVLAVIQYPIQGKSDLEGFQILLKNSEVSTILENATKIIFYSNSSNFTLIPSVFFDQKKLPELTAAVIDIDDSDSALSSFIPEIDGHIAFTQKNEIINLLKTNIGHIDIRHHFASLISTYHLFYAKKGTKMAFIQYHNQKFTLCLMEGKKMISFNVFGMNSFEDVIYYPYYSMEQFEFSPAVTEIHIGGKYAQNDSVLSTLQRYTKTIFHLKPTCCLNLEQTKADALINTIFDIQCG